MLKVFQIFTFVKLIKKYLTHNQNMYFINDKNSSRHKKEGGNNVARYFIFILYKENL